MKKIILLLLVLFVFNSHAQSISDAAISLTKQQVTYDPSYYSISYPNGDIPEGKGVCTDVVIRTFRKMGIDLQKEVHEDMKKNFHLINIPLLEVEISKRK